MLKRVLLAGTVALSVAPVLAQTTMPSPAPAPAPSVSPSAPSTVPPAAGGNAGTMSSGGGMNHAGFLKTQDRSEMRTSKLIGATVNGTDDSRIGDVNDVLLDRDGKVHAVVIGVGGLMGVGEKDVALPYSDLQITPTSAGDSVEKVTIRYTKDQLNNAPTFEWYKSASSSSTTTTTTTTRPASPGAMPPATTGTNR